MAKRAKENGAYDYLNSLNFIPNISLEPLAINNPHVFRARPRALWRRLGCWRCRRGRSTRRHAAPPAALRRSSQQQEAGLWRRNGGWRKRPYRRYCRNCTIKNFKTSNSTPRWSQTAQTHTPLCLLTLFIGLQSVDEKHRVCGNLFEFPLRLTYCLKIRPYNLNITVAITTQTPSNCIASHFSKWVSIFFIKWNIFAVLFGDTDGTRWHTLAKENLYAFVFSGWSSVFVVTLGRGSARAV